jgi:ubiquinone/menaquinone biosynthesis C-methylase UbiE
MIDIWKLRSKLYDVCEGSDLRRGPYKRALFQHIVDRTLFLAVGTGLDIRHLPPKQNIFGIEISESMLLQALPRARAYDGTFVLLRADAQQLPFRDAVFDTVVTSCTMCSVPDANSTFRELHRVLRPGGSLLMFEHVQSDNCVLAGILRFMNLFEKRTGTDMTRRTLQSAIRANFKIETVSSVYLDIILAVYAVKGSA